MLLAKGDFLGTSSSAPKSSSSTVVVRWRLRVVIQLFFRKKRRLVTSTTWHLPIILSELHRVAPLQSSTSLLGSTNLCPVSRKFALTIATGSGLSTGVSNQYRGIPRCAAAGLRQTIWCGEITKGRRRRTLNDVVRRMRVLSVMSKNGRADDTTVVAQQRRTAQQITNSFNEEEKKTDKTRNVPSPHSAVGTCRKPGLYVEPIVC